MYRAVSSWCCFAELMRASEVQLKEKGEIYKDLLNTYKFPLIWNEHFTYISVSCYIGFIGTILDCT